MWKIFGELVALNQAYSTSYLKARAVVVKEERLNILRRGDIGRYSTPEYLKKNWQIVN